MSRDTELAWAAGFFDGEGCISASKQRVRKDGTLQLSLQMSVTQTDLRPLLRFQAALGFGEIRARNYSSPRLGTKQQWYWSAYTAKAERAFLMLYGYLSDPKREQMERCRDKLRQSRFVRPAHTTCVHGHDLTLPGSTYPEWQRRGGEMREYKRCKICTLERNRQAKDRRLLRLVS